MALQKLKPCPFCGSDNISWCWNLSLKFGYFAYIQCQECKAQTRPVSISTELCKKEGFSNPDNKSFWENESFQTAGRLWNHRRRRRKEVEK